jgi:hypothetical protein
MSSIPLISGATNVLKIKPNNSLIPSELNSIDNLFDFNLLSDTKFETWKNIATDINKIGVIENAVNVAPHFIDSDFDPIDTLGSLWFKGKSKQDYSYYLQTGEFVDTTNSPVVFSNHITSVGFNEPDYASIDRTGNKIVQGYHITHSQPGILGKSFGFLMPDYYDSIYITPQLSETFNVQKLTISMLIKDNNILSDYSVMLQHCSSDYMTIGMLISTYYGGYMYGSITGLTESSIEFKYSDYVSNGVPFLLTYVFDGTQVDANLDLQDAKRMKVYVNNINIPLTFYGHVPTHTWAGVEESIFNIGTNGYTFNGNIDEFRIVNDSWSPEEINRKYNQIFNKETFWTVTVQPIISSVTNLTENRWQINGSGFKPGITDPYGTIGGVAFVVEPGVTDSSFTVIEGEGTPYGNQIFIVINSDGESDSQSMDNSDSSESSLSSESSNSSISSNSESSWSSESSNSSESSESESSLSSCSSESSYPSESSESSENPESNDFKIIKAYNINALEIAVKTYLNLGWKIDSGFIYGKLGKCSQVIHKDS